MRRTGLTLAITLVLFTFVYIAPVQAACPLGFPPAACGTNPGSGKIGDETISIVYDPSDGTLALDAAGKQITALEFVSSGGLFRGTKPPQVTGLFDLFTNKKLFVLRPTNPIGDEMFGAVFPAGLSQDALMKDLTVSGALWPHGGLGSTDFIYVPEPTTVFWLAGSMLLVAAHRAQGARQRLDTGA